MIALIVGILFLAFSVFACVPGPLNWWVDVLAFLRGSLPVLALLVGFVAVFIGLADIKDRLEAKREEAEEAAQSAQKSETPKD
ncbi:MAG TPA: hypothetical protein VMC79_04175 [Rectinemataceae bacterium]|nr:hypothetical protein [Rectinemataceae bacterium]